MTTPLSRLLIWEVMGFLFIVTTGIPLHYCFEWFGQNDLIGWFAPVNESTWEHFKLFFWPGVLFSLIEYCVIGRKSNSFWKAKSLGLLSMPVTITVLFYGYTAILGHHLLMADILVFVLAVAFGQFISYRTLKSTSSTGRWWPALIILTAVVFVWFTYDPPQMFLFKDPITSGYGLQQTWQINE